MRRHHPAVRKRRWLSAREDGPADGMSESPRLRLPDPTLCLVTDLGVVARDSGLLVNRVSVAVAVAVENGVNLVQVRAPELDSGEFERLVNEIVGVVAGRALTLVNPSSRTLSYHDGVDGVQLGENASVTVAEIREMYGKSVLVGRSVHSLVGAQGAKESGADFVVLGTIFPSGTHPGGETHGSGIVRRVVNETGLDVIGIGGITAKNVGEVIGNGARGVAVIRSILGGGDPGLATRDLMAAMLSARQGQV